MSGIDPAVLAELAPTGVLRAGTNLSNFLLVTGNSASGEPQGVSPDLSRAIAERLGVPVHYVTYERPGPLADDAGADAWDIGLIGAEPKRAEKIAFTEAYAEIRATYLVPPGSRLDRLDAVDRPGVRIAVAQGSAYDLWLTANLKHATLVRAPGIEDSYVLFERESLDALAGLAPRLLSDVTRRPDQRILDGHFTSVQQAVGTARENAAGAAFLAAFVRDAKRSGLIAALIEKHGAQGLSVAP